MKKIFTTFSFVALTALAIAQTTATNFTANDCAGNPHELFSELNAGKVVIMAWVMPCASCEGPTATAYDVFESFQTSHPGKVLFYLIDDYGDNNCALLNNWANAKAGPDAVVFQNTGETIPMSDYGTNGMPKIVVTGGYNHQVYFNKNNAAADDETGILSAVNSGLNEILSAKPVSLTNASWMWDAASRTGSLRFTANAAGTLRYAVYNLLGQPVSRERNANVSAGHQGIDVDLQELPKGAYFLRFRLNGSTSTYRISIP